MADCKKKRRRRHKRNAENPNVPLSVALWGEEAADALGAEKSVAGVRVTRKKALGYAAVWRAINLISGDVGKLPLSVYRQIGRNRELAKDHPAYRLLRRKPSDAMTAFVFKQTLQAHVLTEGNAYAYIDRDGAGRPLQLLILDPTKVEPVRMNGQLWYVYDGSQGKDKLPSVDVLHIRGLGFDGLQGYPVLQYHNETLGVALAARDHSGSYFRNGAKPGGLLKHPGKLSPTARTNMRQSWERLHSGLRNAHKIAILEEGAEYVSFNSNARDAQLLENREYDSREVANIFGVPTHKLGDPSKVAYNSLGQENQSYYDDTLARWLQLWAEECHDKLLSESEKASESHTIDFDYQVIKRADMATQKDFAKAMVDSQILDVDEARAIFDYNPKATPTPTPEPQSVRTDGLRAIIADTVGRMVRRLVGYGSRFKGTTADEWSSHIRQISDDQREFVGNALAPVMLVANDLGFTSVTTDDAAALIVIDATYEIHRLGVAGSEKNAEAIADRVASSLTLQILGA